MVNCQLDIFCMRQEGLCENVFFFNYFENRSEQSFLMQSRPYDSGKEFGVRQKKIIGKPKSY